MERYLVELDGDQVELLSGMVREAMKVADEKKVPTLEALLSALGTLKLESRRSQSRLSPTPILQACWNTNCRLPDRVTS
jgi:hypothetical protein